jgi:hypothetical protein
MTRTTRIWKVVLSPITLLLHLCWHAFASLVVPFKWMNMIFVHAFLQCHDSKIFYYTGTLFYVTTLKNQFRSARRAVNNVFVSSEACLGRRKKIPCAVLNVTCDNHILTTICWNQHVDTDSQQNGIAASAAPFAVACSGLSEVMMRVVI